MTKQNEITDNKTSTLKSNIFIIDKSLGIAGCGLKTDFKIVLKRARKITKNFSFVYGKTISASILTNELSTFFLFVFSLARMYVCIYVNPQVNVCTCRFIQIFKLRVYICI